MSCFTIYLDEYEERDRKQRRRTKILGAFAIIAMLMAMRRPDPPPQPPPPKPIVILKTERIAVPVIVKRTETVTVREPRFFKLLPAAWPNGEGLPDSGLRARHLCVTPKRLTVAGANDHVTVSNVGDTPLLIRAIGVLPERSGFVIDAADCANKRLGAGERCTIGITAREARNEPIYLLIDDDRGDYDIAEITASPASRGPAT